jgi:hypothetical protein
MLPAGNCTCKDDDAGTACAAPGSTQANDATSVAAKAANFSVRGQWPREGIEIGVFSKIELLDGGGCCRP